METFKQYHNQILSEMSAPARVANDILSRARDASDTARQARRGRAGQEEINAAMKDMVNAHKSLDQYSSHELKDKIVDKYNELKAMLQGESNEDPTVQHLEDCVQYIQTLCDDILAG
jgi:hypothetical protein